MKLTKIALIGLLAFSFASCGDKSSDQSSEEQSNTTEGSTTVEAAPANYNINPNASEVAWKGTLLGVFSHTGTVALTSGSLSTENGEITGGEFTVDLNQLSTTDSNYKQGSPEKLIGHLQTEAFFDTKNFPNANFVIRSVEGNTIKGDMTIRGKTNEETVKNVTLTEENGSVIATGQLSFDRQKYDVSWNFAKDMTVSDEVELTISLKGNAG